MTAAAGITVAVINYNGAAVLGPTLDSVLAQTGIVLHSILAVDNHSSDDSLSLLRARYAGRVQVIEMPDNRGPNPARNAALRAAETELVLIMDNDLVLAPDYVQRLAAVFAAQPGAGAVTGQIRLHAEPQTMQYCGAFLHYAAEVVVYRPRGDEPARVGTVSAGAALYNRSAALAADAFDEDLFFGWEDGDLAFRMAALGHPCYAAPAALAYHMARPRGTRWIALQTRNRWWFVVRHYDSKTLWLALPALIFYQACAGVFFLFKGQGGEFARGAWHALCGLSGALRKRRAFVPRKLVSDRELLCGGRPDPPPGVRGGLSARLAGVAGALLAGYWRLIAWAL